MLIDPQTGCCMGQPACPTGETPQPCQDGQAIDPQTGCCKNLAVEACFLCPGGLPELASALSGGPNSCYLVSQTFMPPGAALPVAVAP